MNIYIGRWKPVAELCFSLSLFLSVPLDDFLLIIATAVKSDLFTVCVTPCWYGVFQKSITMGNIYWFSLVSVRLSVVRCKRDILYRDLFGAENFYWVRQRYWEKSSRTWNNEIGSVDFDDGKPFFGNAVLSHDKQIIETNKRTNFPNFRGDCYKLRRWCSAAQNELMTLNLRARTHIKTHPHTNVRIRVSKHRLHTLDRPTGTAHKSLEITKQAYVRITSSISERKRASERPDKIIIF